MNLLLQKHGFVILGSMGAGLILGMGIHAFTFKTSFEKKPQRQATAQGLGKAGEATEESQSTAPDLSSSKQLVEALFPGARIGGGDKNTPLDPTTLQIQSVIRSPVSSYQKVASLMNLAKTLAPDHRRLAYASASFVCGPQEFQQLMLPLVWDPALPTDQAQVLAAGVVGLADPVRLPICLTLLKHPDESIRATAQSVLAAYFPETDEASYPQAVQHYLTHPD